MRALRRIGWVAASVLLFVGSASAQPATLYSTNPSLRLPVRMDDATRSRMAEIKLYVRGRDGDWQCLATVQADKPSIDCTLPGDGAYSLLFVMVDRNGKNYPSSLAGAIPQRMVIVDTVKPDVEVKTVSAANGERYLQATMKDANPDPRGIQLSYQLPDGTWRKLDPLGPDSPNVFRIGDPALPTAQLRATLHDLAGNTATCDIMADAKPAPTGTEPAAGERRAAKPPEPLLPAIVSDGRPAIQTVGFETRDVRTPAWPKPLPLSIDLPDAPLTFEVATQVLQKQVDKAAAEVPDDFGKAKPVETKKAEPAKLPELPDLMPKAEEKKPEPAKLLDMPKFEEKNPEPVKTLDLPDLMPKKAEPEAKKPEPIKAVELPDLTTKMPEPAAKKPEVPALPELKPLDGPSIGVPDLALPPIGGVQTKVAEQKKPDGPSIGVPELSLPDMKPAGHVERKPAPADELPIQKLTSRRMVLEYEGPRAKGVQPDYWVSADGLRTWRPMLNDAKPGEGLSFTLPGEGVFAVRIRPLGGKEPPAPGEKPDCMVEVKIPAVK